MGEFFGKLLLMLLIWILLLPVTLILITPFILVLALFGRKAYAENVRSTYAGVIDSWLFRFRA